MNKRGFFIGILLIALALLGSLWLSHAPSGANGFTQNSMAADCVGVMPQPETLPGAMTHIFKETTGKDGSARALRLHVFASEAGAAPRPAILYFFGGGFRRGSVMSFAERAQALSTLGYVAIIADYRVHCRDQTGVRSALEDARDAYDWVRGQSAELGIDRDQIALAGGSAGGYLAATAAMLAPVDEKPSALVLYNPLVDLVAHAPLHLKLFARRASPSALSKRDLPPTIIFHGTADEVVGIDSVRSFCLKATVAGRICELNEYQGQGHSFYHSKEVGTKAPVSPYVDTQHKTFAFLKTQLDVEDAP